MYKRTLVFFAAAVLIVLAAVVGIKAHSAGETEPDLLTQNVEALTYGEAEQHYYTVHHVKYYNPYTGLKTDKCYAYSYNNPNGKCILPHNHQAIACCTINCY